MHIHRVPNDPQDSENGTLISFYALYPNGTQNNDLVPVPLTAAQNAWSERLGTIQQRTNLKLSVVNKTEEVAESTTGSSDLDWPLVLGISMAGVLLLVLGVCVLVL